MNDQEKLAQVDAVLAELDLSREDAIEVLAGVLVIASKAFPQILEDVRENVILWRLTQD